MNSRQSGDITVTNVQSVVKKLWPTIYNGAKISFLVGTLMGIYNIQSCARTNWVYDSKKDKIENAISNRDYVLASKLFETLKADLKPEDLVKMEVMLERSQKRDPIMKEYETDLAQNKFDEAKALVDRLSGSGLITKEEEKIYTTQIIDSKKKYLLKSLDESQEKGDVTKSKETLLALKSDNLLNDDERKKLENMVLEMTPEYMLDAAKTKTGQEKIDLLKKYLSVKPDGEKRLESIVTIVTETLKLLEIDFTKSDNFLGSYQRVVDLNDFINGYRSEKELSFRPLDTAAFFAKAESYIKKAEYSYEDKVPNPEEINKGVLVKTIPITNDKLPIGSAYQSNRDKGIDIGLVGEVLESKKSGKLVYIKFDQTKLFDWQDNDPLLQQYWDQTKKHNVAYYNIQELRIVTLVTQLQKSLFNDELKELRKNLVMYRNNDEE